MADTDAIIRVAAFYGWKKNAKEGLLVEVFVNDSAISKGELVSNPAQRQREMWWAKTLDVAEGTVIRLETKVGIRGAGRDNDRTTSNCYIARRGFPIRDIHVPRVGFRNFPLLKGPLEIILQQSVQDETDRQLDTMLEDIENQ